MSGKIPVGIIGATGMVGQNFIRLLDNHPWFDVVYLAASPRSAGKTYKEAVSGKWVMKTEIPSKLKELIVKDAGKADDAVGKCRLIFSAVDLDKKSIQDLEMAYAKKGIVVVSNNSAHRHTAQVPMMIPEINHGHLDILEDQKKTYGFDKGLIVVKPNCSIQSYMTPVHALQEAGYKVDKMFITTLQAVSGAGYPGLAVLDLIDNIVPNLAGEEEKSEQEPRKIFAQIKDGDFVYDDSIQISAHCNRVPVIDGHTACVSLSFKDKKPSIEEMKQIWENYSSLPQELDLPYAPQRAIIVMDEAGRPQPQKDRDLDKAMAVSVGCIRECSLFDYKFVGLSHNTVRGAAGGAVLIAELLKAKGFVE